MKADRLPPLQTLRAFESAARHLNFTRAAEELHLTHSAVSHQIAALEERLGRKLFHRHGRTMQIDPAGAQLAIRLREHFDGIAAALAAARSKPSEEALVLSVLPSFAARWLLPRLPGFCEQHPEIALNIRTSVALADLSSDGVMLALRYGGGSWPGLVAEALLPETLIAVAAPGLRRPRTIAALAGLPVLEDVNHPWSLWLAAAGRPELELRVASTFTDSSLLIDAATRGLGIALARATLAARAIDEGRLVRVFSVSVASPRAYYVVYPPALAADVRVAAFRAWVQAEARADRPARPMR